mgnify:CR=1 FL=1
MENTKENRSQAAPWEILLVSFLTDSNRQQRLFKNRFSLTRLLQTTYTKAKLFIRITVVSNTSFFPSADEGWEPSYETFPKSNKNHRQYQEEATHCPQPPAALCTTPVNSYR